MTYDEVIPDIIRFLLPIPPDAEPLGKYEGLSEGLGNPPITTILRLVDIKQLLAPMQESERYQQLIQPDSKLHMEIERTARQAKAKQQKAAARLAERQQKAAEKKQLLLFLESL